MQIQFDSAKLINDIIKALNVQLDLVSKILIEFMIGEISQSKRLIIKSGKNTSPL